eukprot:scaffold4097_cov166-Amphora_coffeaeformis.AAC.67
MKKLIWYLREEIYLEANRIEKEREVVAMLVIGMRPSNVTKIQIVLAISHMTSLFLRTPFREMRSEPDDS